MRWPLLIPMSLLVMACHESVAPEQLSFGFRFSAEPSDSVIVGDTLVIKRSTARLSEVMHLLPALEVEAGAGSLVVRGVFVIPCSLERMTASATSARDSVTIRINGGEYAVCRDVTAVTPYEAVISGMPPGTYTLTVVHEGEAVWEGKKWQGQEVDSQSQYPPMRFEVLVP